MFINAASARSSIEVKRSSVEVTRSSIEVTRSSIEVTRSSLEETRSSIHETGSTDCRNESPHPSGVFHSGTRFDAAGGIDRERLRDLDGVGDVFRGEAAGEEEVLVRMRGGDFVELLPGKGLTRPPESARDMSIKENPRSGEERRLRERTMRPHADRLDHWQPEGSGFLDETGVRDAVELQGIEHAEIDRRLDLLHGWVHEKANPADLARQGSEPRRSVCWRNKALRAWPKIDAHGVGSSIDRRRSGLRGGEPAELDAGRGGRGER